MRTAPRYGFVTTLLLCSACGDPELAGDPVGTTVEKLIGAQGGMVSTPAGAAIIIPPGAVAGDTMISITAIAAIPPAMFGTAVGKNYQFGPPGTVFLKPVTMNLPFGNLPDGVDPMKDLQILTAPDGTTQFTSLGPAKLVDSSHAGATTLHFSQCIATFPPGSGSGSGGGGGGGGGGGPIPGQCFPSCAGSSSTSGSVGMVDAGMQGDPGGGPGMGGDASPDGGTTTNPGATTTCGCQAGCMSDTYQLSCDGTTCSCIKNGVVTAMTAQSAQCGDTLNVWTTFCGFPAMAQGDPSGTDAGMANAGTDGGQTDPGGFKDAGANANDAGPAGCSAATCGGGGGFCMCENTCNGAMQRLLCEGNQCSCLVNGVSQKTFSGDATSCTPANFTGQCTFQGP